MVSAMAGNNAWGMPKNMATMSTTYVPISSGFERAKARPSRTPRKLGRCAPIGGGEARINVRATSDAAKLTASTAECGGQADGHDEHPANGWSEEHAERAAQRVQCAGGSEIVALHKPRHQRIQRRALQGGEASLCACQDKDRPQERLRQQRVEEEQCGEDCEGNLCREHHGSTVSSIRQRAADHRQCEHGDELGHAEKSNQQWRVRELVDLVRHRDVGDLTAQKRDELAPEEQSKVTVPQRRNVDRRPAQQAQVRHAFAAPPESAWRSLFDLH
jgi:hypothetical protein